MHAQLSFKPLTSLQSVSKATKVPDGDAHGSSLSGEKAAARVSGVSTQARVRLADCASLIYDCSIALIATAHEECKHLPALVCQEARRSIFRAWRSDFEAAQLREGNFRYGNEFAIMAELMPLDDDQDLRASGISGSDVVAAGYVAAASARHCLMYLAGGSSSKHLFEFRAALSTFFRALFMCDNTPASVDILRDTAARYFSFRAIKTGHSLVFRLPPIQPFTCHDSHLTAGAVSRHQYRRRSLNHVWDKLMGQVCLTISSKIFCGI